MPSPACPCPRQALALLRNLSIKHPPTPLPHTPSAPARAPTRSLHPRAPTCRPTPAVGHRGDMGMRLSPPPGTLKPATGTPVLPDGVF